RTRARARGAGCGARGRESRAGAERAREGGGAKGGQRVGAALPASLRFQPAPTLGSRSGNASLSRCERCRGAAVRLLSQGVSLDDDRADPPAGGSRGPPVLAEDGGEEAAPDRELAP